MLDLRSTAPALVMIVALAAPSYVAAQTPSAPMDDGADGEGAITPPRLRRQPPLFLESGVESTYVEIELTISEAGRAVDPELVAPGDPDRDRRALEAVPDLSFEPARRGGEPVAVRLRYRMLFAPARDVVDSQPGSPPDDAEHVANESPVGDAEASEAPAQPTDPWVDETYVATAEVTRPAQEVTRHTLEAEELERIPGTRGDPLRAVEVLPGVARTGLDDGAPRLRGSAAADSITLIAGEPTPLLYHFGGLTSVVHPKLLSRIDLYPGNFSVRYGRITGGVLSASLRDPRTDGFHGSVDVNTIDTSLLVEAPLGDDVAVALAGRRSILDLYFGSFVPEDAYSVVAAPVYYDGQALLTAHLGRDHVLRFVGMASHDSLELFLDKPPDGEPDLAGEVAGAIGFYRARLSLDSRLGEDVGQQLALSYGLVDATTRIGSTDARVFQHQINGRAEWSARLDPKLGLVAGIDVMSQVIDGDYSGDRPPQGEGNPNIGNPDNGTVDLDTVVGFAQPAAYLELRYRPHPDLLLQPGARLDYYSQLGRVSVDPRLVVRYQLAAQTVLKSGVGLFSQPPIYYESMAELGNAELDVTRAIHTGFGVEQGLFGRAQLNAEIYYKHLLDRVVATEGGSPPFFVNDGQGRIYGLETSLRAEPIDGMSAFVAYTLARSERRDRDEGYRLFDRDQTHTLTTALGYHFGRGWGVGARFRLISGHPTSPVAGSSFNASAGLYTPIYGATNSVRSPLFHQLDVNAEKKWSFETWSLTAYLSVLNVYNHVAEEGRSYSYDYRQSEAITGLPLLPSLGIRGEL